MNKVVVIVMGGGEYTYEAGSSFEVSSHWLTVKGTSRTPVAVFAQHRVVRAFYVYENNKAVDLVGGDGKL